MEETHCIFTGRITIYLYAMYENILKNSTKSYARYHESIYTIGVNYRF
jgi:hypothetical protein